MGTWGYDPLDSDAALDAQHLWENYVQPRYLSSPGGEEDIVAFFERRWGDAVQCGDNITNAEIIAVVELFRANDLRITKRLKVIAQEAINRELVEAELHAWDDPDRREESLLSLLASIGAKRRAPQRVKMFGDPTLEYPNRSIAERELTQLTTYGKKLMFSYDLFNDPELKASAPQFLQTLNRFMSHGTWEKDSNVAIEAKSQRLMMLAYYLGMSLGYDEERIRGLIRDAKWEAPKAD